MIWNNVRTQRSSKLTSSVICKFQVRHKSEFPLSPSFLPQNNRKPVQQLPRHKTGSVSLGIGAPQFYKKPVIRHNVIQAAKARMLRDAISRPKSAEIGDDVPRVQRLDPAIEDDVNKEILRDLNFFTTDAISHYDTTIRHPDIVPSIRGYLDRHRLQSEPVKSMLAALQDLLPQDPLNQQIESADGLMSHRRFRYMETQGVTSPDVSQMSLQWYLLMSNIPIKPEDLLEDGTNRRFMPGNADVWPYRLWAAGSITQHSEEALPIDSGQTIHKIEKVVNLRVEGKPDPERAFVTIQKDFFAIDAFWPQNLYNKENVLKALSGKSSIDQDSPPQSSFFKRPRHSPPKPQLPNQYRHPFTTETYTLCFLRNPPDFSSISTRIVAPPTLPRFQHTFTPTRHLLFCWSALTYNAHLIHFDPEYARSIYKAPNLLVHGPLTAFLALEWFERTLTQYAIDREFEPFELRSVEYRNLAPLYVDEPMTVCTKPTRFQAPGTLADSWDVWIEKGVRTEDGEMKKTMVFKATVKLAVGEVLKREKEDKGDVEQEGKNRSGGFTSPYF